MGELYSGDLPNISSLRSKVHSWYIKWKSEKKEHGSGSLPSALNSTLSQTSNFSPNIKALITILCILPVTSCTAERSFSGFKRIKTALRSTMSNERLSNLALLHLQQDIPIDTRIFLLTLMKLLMHFQDCIQEEFNFQIFDLLVGYTLHFIDLDHLLFNQLKTICSWNARLALPWCLLLM